MSKSENAETVSTLGKILPDNHNMQRDAVHIAVMPVIAGEDMQHGTRVRLAWGTTNVVMRGEYNDDYIGIIDPFLMPTPPYWVVKKGQKCWMWLRPMTITGLRHDWSHPVIDNPPTDKQPEPTGESERWLREFADKWNFDYNEMISEAMTEDGYVVARGIDLHGARDLDSGDEELFWKHLANLTGKTFTAEHQKSFGWTCSC